MSRILTVVFLFLSLYLGPLNHVAEAQQKPQYNRNEIRDARYGDDNKQTELQQAYNLDTAINAEIFGQEYIAQALRDKLVQYLENFGQRKNEPIALNLMGLPGIGKSAMLKVLAKSGIPILMFDAQKYANNGSAYTPAFADELTNLLNSKDLSKPLIIVVEELDKAPEIDAASQREKTQAIIGTINQILVDGRFNSSYGNGTKDLSNSFILTTMNLAPNEITNFSKDALGEPKSFYDFTVEDFQKFHEWVLSHPAAIPKLLSNLFRSNTVSRLAPLSVLVKPLDNQDYSKVTIKTVKVAIDRNTGGQNSKARMEVTFSDAFINYLNQKTIYAPSGARNTVTKADQLTEQLINYAKRSFGSSPASLLLPRKIFLDFDEKSQAVRIVVTPLKIVNNKDLVEGTPFEFPVAYSNQSNQFIQPKDLATSVPKVASAAKEKGDVILGKDVKASRFPPQSNKASGLAAYIDSSLYGQEQFSKMLEGEMNQYMVRPADAQSSPHGVVFAGFPGIGKSEMIRLSAEYMEIPVIKINLQQYTSDSTYAVSDLMSNITEQVQALRTAGKQKYILLFEELDKIFEINAKGEQVNRPVMSIVKDIMNNGQTEYSYTYAMNGTQKKMSLDVRDGFIATTMNFAVDRFDFKADPRLTTVEDVQEAWRRLSTRLADLKKLLGSMFLPETVNRLIAQVNILKPLNEADYRKVIAKQIELVLEDRFTDSNWRNVGQIRVRSTPAYRKYLFSESVVPSEGARFTANVSRSLVNMDVEGLTKKIPRNSKFASKPLTFVLDYKPGSKTVVGDIVAGDKSSDQLLSVYKREVDLNFPPLHISGKIPQDRLITSIHEFGHALATMRAGMPFEFITVVPPSNGTGGYVKFRSNPRFANEFIGRIYSGLASRAMERVMMSPNPLKSESALDITAGASSDILQVTKLLFNALKELGFDPFGGVIERMGMEGPIRYANFSDLPHETVEALGAILKDVENTLVKDFLSAHPKEWYAEKISTLAHEGGMTERQFYELLEANYPGDGWQRIEKDSMIFELFKGKVKETNVNAPESNFQNYRNAFLASVNEHLHPASTDYKKSNQPKNGRTRVGSASICVDLLRTKPKNK